MSAATVRRVVCRLGPDRPPTDAELVAAIAPTSPNREAAFAELVGRYGPMVFGVCRRVLADAHDAEDAFQATFLVLARRAGTIRPPGAAGGWLYGVAVRTARKAKTAAARRRRREMAAVMAADPNEASVGSELDRAELRAVIDAELAALPEPHRAAIVLCDLQGKTRGEAALELNRAEGTVASWLSRGRKALAVRLARRGVALSAAGVAAAVTPSSVSAELTSAAVTAVLGRGATVAVLALAEGVMRSLSSGTTKLVAAVVAAGALMAAVATAGAWYTADEPRAAPPVAASPDAPAPKPEPDMKGFADHKGYVYSVAYAPDGKTFVSVGNKTAIVWDADTRKKLFAAEAEFASFSGDGKSLFVLVKDEFQTLDPTTGKVLATKKRGQPKSVDTGTTAAFSPDGSSRVEFDGQSHHLRGDFKGEAPVLAGQKGGAYGDVKWIFGRGAAFSPDGSRFAGIHWKPADSPDKDGVLSVWNATTGALIGTIAPDSAHRVNSFAWSPDGNEIAVGCGDVRVYDAKTLKQARKFDAEWADIVGRFSAVAWSKDGKTLAAGRRVERDRPLPTGGGGVEAVTIDVQLLDAQTGKELRRIDGFPDNLPVVSLAFRPDGKQLVAGAGFFPGKAADVPTPAKDAKGLRVIPLGGPPAKPAPTAWKEVAALELTGWLGGSVAYSADGKALYVGGSGGNVRAYDAATRKKLWETKDGEHFTAVAAAPDGETLAAAVKNGVRFFDAATGKAGDTLEEKDGEPLAVAYFPDVPGPNVLVNGRPAINRKLIFGNARGHFVKTWLAWPNVSTIQTNTVAAGKKPADEYAVPLAVDPAGKRVVLTGPIERDTGKNVLWAWSAGSGEANKLLEGHKAVVTSAAWSKDGKVIVTGDADGVVITWDATTFKEKSRLSLGGRVAAVAISANGKHVAAAVVRPSPGALAAYFEEVFIWDAAAPPKQPKPLANQQAGGPFGGPFAGVASVAFSPDGKSLVSAFCNFDHLTKLGDLVGKVRVFAVEPEEAKPDPVTWIHQIVYSPDGTRYAVVPGGVFDATGKKLYDVPGEAVGFSADGKTLFAMGAKVLECDAATGKVLKEHPRPKPKWDWQRVAFAPDGKRFAVHFGLHVRVYDTATGFEPVRLDGQFETAGWLQSGTGLGQSVAFSPDGKRIVAVGVLVTKDGQMGAAVWDAGTGARLHAFEADFRDGPRAAAFSTDGRTLAVGYGKRAVLYDAATFKEVKTLGEQGETTALAFSPDGKRLATGIRLPILHGGEKVPRVIGHKTEVRLIDIATDKVVRVFDGFEGVDHMAATKLPVTALAFSPDGKKLLAGTGFPLMTPFGDDLPRKGEVKVFALDGTPAPVAEQKWTDAAILEDHKALVNGVAVAPDGKTFAAATESNVTCWDAATRKVLWTKKADMRLLALAYSPDGKALAVTSDKGTTFYDAANGEAAPTGPSGGGDHAAAYSPDGKWLATSDGRSTSVRDLSSKDGAGRGLGPPPPGEVNPVRLPAGIAWSADSKRLALIHHEKADGKYAATLWEFDAKADAVKLLRGHADPLTCVAWSKDGKVLATGDEKGVVILWDAATGKELWRRELVGLFGAPGRVNALAISPADNTVAVSWSPPPATPPEVVVLLSPKDGKEVDRLKRQWKVPVTSVAWAKDGKFLVTGCGALPGHAVKQTEPAAGEVVVWERKP